MDDVDENAHLVNALQRYAAVVVQKSLVEGFGLTVTEPMWKSRPVVASAIGGIRDQIEHGVSGLLLDDPFDLVAMPARSTRCCATTRRPSGSAGVPTCGSSTGSSPTGTCIQYADMFAHMIEQ